MTPERAYEELKAYQEAGMISYVLPTDPLGESWVLGLHEAPLAKFTGTDIVTFLIGVNTAMSFLARQKGLL